METSQEQQDFQLSNCDWLGFDLDHTVIRYNVPALEELEFDSFKKFFVENLKYKGAEEISFDVSRCFRGVVVDLTTGNTLKIDCDNNVIKGYHGNRELTNKELQTIYPDPLAYEGIHTDDLWSVSTFFEAGVGPLWIGLVELEDKQDGESDYRKLFNDLKKGIEFNFYVFPEGYFFPEIVTNPEKYLFKRDEVVEWFKQITSAAAIPKPVRLFLLTNSDTDYAKFLADYCLGPEWEELFDLVLYFGGKPKFWHADTTVNFEKVIICENNNGSSFKNTGESPIDIRNGKHYRRGNGKHLSDFLAASVPEGEQVKVCYFGDHLIGDCVKCKSDMGWDVVAIVEELEHQHGGHTAVEEIHTESHEMWGSYFSTIYETKEPKKTFWAEQISKNVDLAIPCLSSLIGFSLDYKHSASEHLLYPCSILTVEETTRGKYYSR